MTKSKKIVIALYLIFALQLLYIIISKIVEEGSFKPVLKFLLLIFTFIFVSICYSIVHETAHMIIGKLFGFDVISINILNLNIVFEDKLRINFSKKLFSLGRCVLYPKKVDTSQFLMMVLAGPISGIVLFILLLIVNKFIMINNVYWTATIIFFFIWVLISLIPYEHKGLYSDTYCLLLSFNKKEYFNLIVRLLAMHNINRKGNMPSQMYKLIDFSLDLSKIDKKEFKNNYVCKVILYCIDARNTLSSREKSMIGNYIDIYSGDIINSKDHEFKSILLLWLLFKKKYLEAKQLYEQIKNKDKDIEDNLVISCIDHIYNYIIYKNGICNVVVREKSCPRFGHENMLLNLLNPRELKEFIT